MWAGLKARLRRKTEPEPTPSVPARDASPPHDVAPANDRRPPAGAPGHTASSPTSRSPSTGRPPAPGEVFSDGMFGQKLKEGTIEDVLDDLEIAMLQADVALPVVERLRRNLRKEFAGRKLRYGVDAEEAIRSSLERSVREILAIPRPDLAGAIRGHAPKPYVILFVGVNGTGKTTTVAKLAVWLRTQGLSCVIAAGDTYRAGAIEQLLVHGERLGIRVVRQQEGSDPAAVGFDAIEHARARGVDVVLVDTAGRQHTNENLVEEAKKIRRVTQPSLTLFVGDALSGNDLVVQAELFQQSIGLDGLVLTKLDADAKGGGALSATFVTQKPILFVGVGQGYDDLRPFEPEWFVRRLFAEEAAG